MNFLAELKQKKLKSVPKPTVATLQQRLQPTVTAITPTLNYEETWQQYHSGAIVPLLQTTPIPLPPLVKVMVLQRNCIEPQELDAILTKEAAATHRKVDFVILPEGAHHEGKDATLVGNALLRNLASIVAKHQVYACLGTMSEVVEAHPKATPTGQPVCHCTALVVGPTGQLVATYRKRATMGLHQTPGLAPCCFETEFGRVGVMICYDAENPQFVKEALDMKPVLVLNPIHISAGVVRGGGTNSTERHSQWRTSLLAMGRYMDRLVSRERGQVTWVRCDQPYPCGAGTSQITSGSRTQTVACCGPTNWSVLVEIGQRLPRVASSSSSCSSSSSSSSSSPSPSSSSSLAAPPPLAPRWICRPPKRDRTLDIDNCGNRYTMKSIEITLDTEATFRLVHAQQPTVVVRNTSTQQHFPCGIVQIVNETTHRIACEIDLFRMMELKQQQRGRGTKVAPNRANESGPNPTPIGDSGCYLTLDQQDDLSLMRLMKPSNTVDMGEVKKQETDRMDECRHVFVGPSNGIETMAYLEQTGIIVTLSKGKGGATPNLLLLSMDKTKNNNTASESMKPKKQKRVLTLWEFAQHRHPVALHDLLK